VGSPPAAPKSVYSAGIDELMQQWPPPGLPEKPGPEPFESRTFSLPEHPSYVGVQAVLWIHSSLDRVSRVVEDIDNYDKIFSGYKTVSVLGRNSSNLRSYWEVRVPVFFIPNIRYELSYEISAPHAAMKVYRYKLLKSNKVKFSDGVVVLEEKTPGLVRYAEFDFFDIDWGILRFFARDRVWKGGLETAILSSLGIKFRSENPGWQNEQVLKEASLQVNDKALDKGLKDRVNFFERVLGAR